MQRTFAEEPVFESGSITLSTGDLKVLKMNLTNKKITLDISDKAFLKRALALQGEITPSTTEPETEDKLPQKKYGGALSMLRTVAEALSNRGITLVVSYQGKRVATVGEQANSTLLQLITKTHAVELNSLFQTLRMIL